MKKYYWIRLLTLILPFLCFPGITHAKSHQESDSTEVLDVQPKEAAERLAEEDIVVLDVRTPEEVAFGRIPGSININISDPAFAGQIAELDPSKTYMVHCAAGSPGGRSRRSIEALKSIGVTKVYHLEGGFSAWQFAKNEVDVPARKKKVTN